MQHDTERAGTIPTSAWRALGVLTLIYVCHSIDRSVMSIVIEPIKTEFDLTDSQIGILGGLVYAVLYAIAGLPLGYLIDRVNRRNLLAGLVAIWSGCTALCGLTQNYVQLLVARAAVGAAEAGGAPTAISMISDLFPERRRSLAISIFWLSTAFGTALSFALGGLIAANYGWRAAFLVAGAPGLVLVMLLLITVREPVRGSSDPHPDRVSDAAPTLGETVRFAFAHPAFLNAFVATALKAAVLSGVLVWVGSYLIRVQGLPLAWAGLVIAVCIAVFGGVGSLLGGWLGDRLYSAGGVRYLPVGPMATSAATAVCVLLFALTDNLYMSVAAFAAFEVFSRMYSAPSYAFIVSSVDPRMRGIAVSTLQVSANLIGYGFGPFVVGVVSDAIGGADSIRYGISGLSVISLWVAVHYYFAYRLTPHAISVPSNPIAMETHS